MTEDNARRNAADALTRADACLQEAHALQAAALPYGAVSRAYYAVFHGARALLFSIGLDARTHKALVSMVGEHFVRPGRLPSTMGRLLSRLQRDREDADYAAAPCFHGRRRRRDPRHAAAFLTAVRRLIECPP